MFQNCDRIVIKKKSGAILIILDYFVDRNVEHDSVTLEVFHSITPSMPSFSPLPCLSDDETQKKKFQHRLMKEKRYRTTFTPEQIEMMQNAFKNEKNPDSTSLQKLSKEINLSKRVLQVWFQNARAKYKKSTFQSERADKLESSESSEDHNTHQINCKQSIRVNVKNDIKRMKHYL